MIPSLAPPEAEMTASTRPPPPAAVEASFLARVEALYAAVQPDAAHALAPAADWSMRCSAAAGQRRAAPACHSGFHLPSLSRVKRQHMLNAFFCGPCSTPPPVTRRELFELIERVRQAIRSRSEAHRAILDLLISRIVQDPHRCGEMAPNVLHADLLPVADSEPDGSRTFIHSPALAEDALTPEEQLLYVILRTSVAEPFFTRDTSTRRDAMFPSSFSHLGHPARDAALSGSRGMPIEPRLLMSSATVRLVEIDRVASRKPGWTWEPDPLVNATVAGDTPLDGLADFASGDEGVPVLSALHSSRATARHPFPGTMAGGSHHFPGSDAWDVPGLTSVRGASDAAVAALLGGMPDERRHRTRESAAAVDSDLGQLAAPLKSHRTATPASARTGRPSRVSPHGKASPSAAETGAMFSLFRPIYGLLPDGSARTCAVVFVALHRAFIGEEDPSGLITTSCETGTSGSALRVALRPDLFADSGEGMVPHRGILDMLHRSTHYGTLFLRLDYLWKQMLDSLATVRIGSYALAAAHALRQLLYLLREQVVRLSHLPGGPHNVSFDDLLHAHGRLQRVALCIEQLADAFHVTNSPAWVWRSSLSAVSTAAMVSRLYEHHAQKRMALSAAQLVARLRHTPRADDLCSAVPFQLASPRDGHAARGEIPAFHDETLDILATVFYAVLRPLNVMITQWVATGTLNDPSDEFFIVEDHSRERDTALPGSSLTNPSPYGHFKLDSSPERLPSFISTATARHFLQAGLSRRALKSAAQHVLACATKDERLLMCDAFDTGVHLMKTFYESLMGQQPNLLHLRVPLVDPLAADGCVTHWRAFFGACNALLRADAGSSDADIGDERSDEETVGTRNMQGHAAALSANRPAEAAPPAVITARHDAPEVEGGFEVIHMNIVEPSPGRADIGKPPLAAAHAAPAVTTGNEEPEEHRLEADAEDDRRSVITLDMGSVNDQHPAGCHLDAARAAGDAKRRLSSRSTRTSMVSLATTALQTAVLEEEAMSHRRQQWHKDGHAGIRKRLASEYDTKVSFLILQKERQQWRSKRLALNVERKAAMEQAVEVAVTVLDEAKRRSDASAECPLGYRLAQPLSDETRRLDSQLTASSAEEVFFPASWQRSPRSTSGSFRARTISAASPSLHLKSPRRGSGSHTARRSWLRAAQPIRGATLSTAPSLQSTALSSAQHSASPRFGAAESWENSLSPASARSRRSRTADPYSKASTDHLEGSLSSSILRHFPPTAMQTASPRGSHWFPLAMIHTSGGFTAEPKQAGPDTDAGAGKHRVLDEHMLASLGQSNTAPIVTTAGKSVPLPPPKLAPWPNVVSGAQCEPSDLLTPTPRSPRHANAESRWKRFTHGPELFESADASFDDEAELSGTLCSTSNLDGVGICGTHRPSVAAVDRFYFYDLFCSDVQNDTLGRAELRSKQSAERGSVAQLQLLRDVKAAGTRLDREAAFKRALHRDHAVKLGSDEYLQHCRLVAARVVSQIQRSARGGVCAASDSGSAVGTTGGGHELSGVWLGDLSCEMDSHTSSGEESSDEVAVTAEARSGVPASSSPPLLAAPSPLWSEEQLALGGFTDTQRELLARVPLYFTSVAATAASFLAHKAVQFALLPPYGTLYRLTTQLCDVCLLQNNTVADRITRVWVEDILDTEYAVNWASPEVLSYRDERRATAFDAHSAFVLINRVFRAEWESSVVDGVNTVDMSLSLHPSTASDVPDSSHVSRSHSTEGDGAERDTSEMGAQWRQGTATVDETLEALSRTKSPMDLLGKLSLTFTCACRDTVLLPSGWLKHYSDLFSSLLFWKSVNHQLNRTWHLGMCAGIPEVFFFCNIARAVLGTVMQHVWFLISGHVRSFKQSLTFGDPSSVVFNFSSMVDLTWHLRVFTEQCTFAALLSPEFSRARQQVYGMLRQVQEMERFIREALPPALASPRGGAKAATRRSASEQSHENWSSAASMAEEAQQPESGSTSSVARGVPEKGSISPQTSEQGTIRAKSQGKGLSKRMIVKQKPGVRKATSGKREKRCGSDARTRTSGPLKRHVASARQPKAPAKAVGPPGRGSAVEGKGSLPGREKAGGSRKSRAAPAPVSADVEQYRRSIRDHVARRIRSFGGLAEIFVKNLCSVKDSYLLWESDEREGFPIGPSVGVSGAAEPPEGDEDLHEWQHAHRRSQMRSRSDSLSYLIRTLEQTLSTLGHL